MTGRLLSTEVTPLRSCRENEDTCSSVKFKNSKSAASEIRLILESNEFFSDRPED